MEPGQQFFREFRGGSLNCRYLRDIARLIHVALGRPSKYNLAELP